MSESRADRLRRIFPDAESARKQLLTYETLLWRACERLQETHPMGEFMGFGLLHVPRATNDICDEVVGLRAKVKRLEDGLKKLLEDLDSVAEERERARMERIEEACKDAMGQWSDGEDPHWILAGIKDAVEPILITRIAVPETHRP